MKKLIPLFLFAISQQLMAQNAVVPVGGDGVSSSGSFSFTVGQVFYKSLNDNATFIIEGVQQPPSGDVLPVTLLYFKVKPQKSPNRALISWSTASENNSDRFIIERSANAQQYLSLKQHPAKGNSATLQTYYDEDANPLSGNSYYRLKMIDKDGSYTYSDVVSVMFGNEFSVKSGPNPAKEFVQLILNGDVPAGMRYVVSDLAGKRLLSNEIQSSKTTINIQNLIPGTYFIQVVQGEQMIKSFKVIKSN